MVAIYKREEETRKMFRQLKKVTDNYSLILVNNGFDDKKFLKKLKPLHYVENRENTGAIRPINQGLDLAEGEYICVLHNDLLVYDEGWLDHVIEFMERRKDVGLVGLGGRHGIQEDGSPDLRTTVIELRGYPKHYMPTWRFTEVAIIDGLGWVMRNIGLKLEESFGMMHFYDLDLSLQYIESGSKVYVAAIDIWHMAEDLEHSARSDEDYLRSVGGDDDEFSDEVREKFRRKWSHLLPIWRGYRDEVLIDQIADDNKQLREAVRSGQEYAAGLAEELRLKTEELERESAEIANGAEYARILEAELENVKEALRRAQSDPGGDVEP